MYDITKHFLTYTVPIFFTIMSLSSSISPCTLAMLSSFSPDSEYRFYYKYKLPFERIFEKMKECNIASLSEELIAQWLVHA